MGTNRKGNLMFCNYIFTGLITCRPTSIRALSIFSVLALALPAVASAQDAERRLARPDDVHRINSVGDLALSPDGAWIAYSVGTSNIEFDEMNSDLFMVKWDGSAPIQLTHTPRKSESHPRFSPDGRYLAFITARSDSNAGESEEPADKSQVWLLNLAGGEARRLTEMPGGVASFAWSPDSSRLVLVSKDPEETEAEKEAAKERKHDTRKPIVVDRYLFKQDVVGYLDDRRTRLYVFDIDDAEATLLTPGPYDNSEPVWGPGGDIIAFTSKRQGDPDRNDNTDIYVVEAKSGAEPRQLTTWEGPDSDPVFSPDGKTIAYLQGGPPKYAGYDPANLATVSVTGGDEKLVNPGFDHYVSSPRWSRDGESLYFLVQDDRIRSVAAIAVSGGEPDILYPTREEPGVARSFEVGDKGVAAIVTFAQTPAEIYRVSDGIALSDHNRELRESIEWASAEAYDVTSDDGVAVGSMLLKPPGYRKGRKYPTIVYVHGGPVSQDGFEFDISSQIFAAQGYLVVNPNYRGSSGRGGEFSRAIYADWGNLEIRDINAVVDKLVEDELSDPDRLGIGGWSYGGINTNFAIATDTRYAAAVSGAGAANYIAGYGTDQYIVQYENEVGLPWVSIDTYMKMSYPFLHADRIKTPTLFMCGELDFNVPLINSEQMYQALRSLDVPTQLVIYPGQYHGLSKPSYIEDRLQRMIDWYGQYLGADL
jgi:dipeptidyl aminopeptidase/acylaminoacyl peptidase